jgi:tRNA-Thr(GGU) m(6)t(6)A37 methyltransferase TsaA
MENTKNIRPVARIRTDFKSKFGVPRQSGLVDELRATVVFEPEFRNADALRGLEDFSHIWVIWGFSDAKYSGSLTVRPPRLGGNRHVGVFASRSPYRPNNIGLSSVRLIGVEQTEAEGSVLIVAGADLLDMTPIFDIKPYLPFTDSHPDAIGGYADGVYGQKLTPILPDELFVGIDEQVRRAIFDCLAEDPRPSYQDDPDRIYGMKFAGLEVKFKVSDNIATVVAVEKDNE